METQSYSVVSMFDGSLNYQVINQDKVPYEQGLDEPLAKLIARELNAIEIDDSPINLVCGFETLRRTRGQLLRFALQNDLVAVFYGQQGVLTNPRTMMKTVLASAGIQAGDFSLALEDYIAGLTGDPMDGFEGIYRWIEYAAGADDVVLSRTMNPDLAASVKELLNTAHGYDTRRGGQEFYAEHPRRCAAQLQSMTGIVVTENMIAATLLHDSIEKSRAPKLDEGVLRDGGIPTGAIDLVSLLTDDMDSREEYFHAILNSDHLDLMLCKLVDINDNGQMHPLFIWDNWEEAQERYTKQRIQLTNEIRTYF